MATLKEGQSAGHPLNDGPLCRSSVVQDASSVEDRTATGGGGKNNSTKQKGTSDWLREVHISPLNSCGLVHRFEP